MARPQSYRVWVHMWSSLLQEPRIVWKIKLISFVYASQSEIAERQRVLTKKKSTPFFWTI